MLKQFNTSKETNRAAIKLENVHKTGIRQAQILIRLIIIILFLV